MIDFHTCSRTSSLGEARSCTNIGTAPWSITTLVFSDVPEAMFVRAQAASNYSNFHLIRFSSIYNNKKKKQTVKGIYNTCNCGKSSLIRNWTNRGTTPACITSSIGGLRSGNRNWQQRHVMQIALMRLYKTFQEAVSHQLKVISWTEWLPPIADYHLQSKHPQPLMADVPTAGNQVQHRE